MSGAGLLSWDGFQVGPVSGSAPSFIPVHPIGRRTFGFKALRVDLLIYVFVYFFQ